ncbi:MAG: trigger factor [Lachnospiraceae bacterium]|nr:trigger factor [Lachnospiraceae bacterium]MDY4968938.1 trigger factor [Lachnospiraceae bacterium]
MKKMMKTAALLLCMALLMAGCSGKSDGETEVSTNAAAETETEAVLTRGDYKAGDYCTITEYKNLKFAESDIKASDEDVQDEIDALIESGTQLEEISEDREVKEGDVVNIDYTGYLNDEVFDGGSAEGADLEIGSGRFIDGFEDGLIGHKKGEEVSLNLTFPETYGNADLAGQDVVFEVKINSIQKYAVPEYTDEFVADNTSYDNIKDYEESVREEIRENNLSQALADKLLDNAEFADKYPESLENYYKQSYASNFDSYLQVYQGITLDQYLESAGTDLDTFLQQNVGEEITLAIKEDLIIGAVAEQEGIQAEGEDYDEFLKEKESQYSMTEEELYNTYGEETVKFVYISGKAYDLIYNSVIVE